MATNKNFVVKNGLEVGGNISVTGSITQSGQTMPATDGTAGQYLQTDGNGTLSWSSVVSNFTISDGTNTDTVDTGQTLTFTAGTGITIAVTDNDVEISGVAQYTDADAIAAVQGAANLTIDGGTLKIDTSNNYVGINDTSPQYELDVNGNIAVGGTVVIDSGSEVVTAQLKNSGVTASTYGSATLIPSFTVDAKGRITSASTNALSISTFDTDDLTEGSTNLYYADSLVDSHLSGGTGVTYSSGTISIGQAVATTSNVTFNDVIVSGNLTVSGTTTTINTTELNIGDNIITLNSDETGTPSADAGIVVERGTSANKSLYWDESEDEWTFNSERVKAGTFEGNLEGNVTGNLTGSVTGTASNAALLDNLDSTQFLRSDVNDDLLGDIRFYGGSLEHGKLKANGDLYLGTTTPVPQAWDIRDTSGNDFFVLDRSNGRVGIGTSSPTELLDLGSGNQNLKFGLRGHLGQAYSTQATILGHSVKAKTDGTISGAMEVTETNSSGGAPAAIRLESGKIEFHTAGSGTDGATFDSERMRIDSSGRVGIGTTSPVVSLDVVGAAQISGRVLVGSVGSGGGVSQGYQFAGDGNTGMYQDAYDQLQFSVAGSERMRIDSSGNVGIGTSSSNAKLEVLASSSESVRLRSYADVGQNYLTFYHNNGNRQGYVGYGASGDNRLLLVQDKNDNIEFYSNGATRMAISSGGKVLIGTTDDQYGDALHVRGSDSGIVISSASSDRPQLRLISGSTESLRLSCNGTYGAIGDGTDTNRYMAFNSGRILIGQTSTSSASGFSAVRSILRASGWHGMEINQTGTSGSWRTLILNNNQDSGYNIDFRNNGSMVGSVTTTSSGTTYNTTSDRRLKENIEPIENGKDILNSMKPCTFNFITVEGPQKKTQHGFIAQEMKEVFPEAVTDPGGEDMMSMDYGRITPVIVAALQDALKEIEELKTRISKLEAK